MVCHKDYLVFIFQCLDIFLKIIASFSRVFYSVNKPIRSQKMRTISIIIAAIVFAKEAQSSGLSLPTRKLNDIEIIYEYTSGRSYNVKFEEAGVSYRFLTGSKPEKWWGVFPYKAFEVDKKIFLASWFEKGYGDYVTLLINLNNKLLYGSAILSGKTVHFHGAKIIKVNGVVKP